MHSQKGQCIAKKLGKTHHDKLKVINKKHLRLKKTHHVQKRLDWTTPSSQCLVAFLAMIVQHNSLKKTVRIAPTTSLPQLHQTQIQCHNHIRTNDQTQNPKENVTNYKTK